MKIILLLVFLSSCAPKRYCSPPKKSKDWAPATQQWMKQSGDGYWHVTTIHGFLPRHDTLFEYKPTKEQLSAL